MAFSTTTTSAQQQQTKDNRNHETTTTYNRDKEYQAAQRAAVESVMVGRETLEQATRQGEQLRNAEYIAEDAEYKLDRAGRILRGMTWAGWWQNKFSGDVEAPEYKTDNVEDDGEALSGGKLPPKVYDDVPNGCDKAVQTIQNYSANLQVLESCEEQDQISTCILICDQMYLRAKKEVEALTGNVESNTSTDFPSTLSTDLSILRKRQNRIQNTIRRSRMQSDKDNNSETLEGKSMLFQGSSLRNTTCTESSDSPIDAITKQQDDHLMHMSQHLDELSSLAVNLNESLGNHSATLESLDSKSESMLFKSKMVTRRTDRLIQSKSWSKTKPEFVYDASIRHIKSGKYIAVSHNNSLILSKKYNETCIFGIWKRQGKVFGLQNKYSRKWAGQNLFGNLTCSATYFDRREEWDADDDWSSTTLLCASAGWGNGGFLLVNPVDEVISIGCSGLSDKRNADLWCIKEET